MQVTVVPPIGKRNPDGGTHWTGTSLPRQSVAVAVNVTTPPSVLVASMMLSVGRVSTGGSRSSS